MRKNQSQQIREERTKRGRAHHENNAFADALDGLSRPPRRPTKRQVSENWVPHYTTVRAIALEALERFHSGQEPTAEQKKRMLFMQFWNRYEKIAGPFKTRVRNLHAVLDGSALENTRVMEPSKPVGVEPDDVDDLDDAEEVDEPSVPSLQVVRPSWSRYVDEEADQYFDRIGARILSGDLPRPDQFHFVRRFIRALEAVTKDEPQGTISDNYWQWALKARKAGLLIEHGTFARKAS